MSGHPVSVTIIMTGNPDFAVSWRTNILPVAVDKYSFWGRVRGNPHKIRPGPYRTVDNTGLKRKDYDQTRNTQQNSQ